MKRLIPVFFLSLLFLSADAQIFGRIVDRAKDKIERKIEDKVVERISEEIARAAMKPIDSAIDEMLKERYEQDSINGRTSADYDGFLNAFLRPVNLPASYEFDYILDCEVKDYDGEKSKMQIWLQKAGNHLGFKQSDGDDENLMVYDIKNDIMAIYSETKDGKQVTAIPSVMNIAAAVNKNEMETKDVSMEKTGKTKKILGYQCDEWLIEDEETISKVYVANDFPVSWKESFGELYKKMLPTTQRDQMPEGMTLKAEAKTKAKNKKSKFEVKKIHDDKHTLNNKEYKQVSLDTASSN